MQRVFVGKHCLISTCIDFNAKYRGFRACLLALSGAIVPYRDLSKNSEEPLCIKLQALYSISIPEPSFIYFKNTPRASQNVVEVEFEKVRILPVKLRSQEYCRNSKVTGLYVGRKASTELLEV